MLIYLISSPNPDPDGHAYDILPCQYVGFEGSKPWYPVFPPNYVCSIADFLPNGGKVLAPRSNMTGWLDRLCKNSCGETAYTHGRSAFTAPWTLTEWDRIG